MIDYSIDEVRIVIKTHAMDEYHRDLMKWLLKQLGKNAQSGVKRNAETNPSN